MVGTPAYFARAGEPRSPADLAGHEAVIYTQESAASWRFTRASTELSVAVHGRFRASGAEGVRAAVLAGIGLAVASRWMFAPELADLSVVPVLTDWTLPPIDLWAIYPAGRLATAKARAFVAFIEPSTRSSVPGFEPDDPLSASSVRQPAAVA